MSKSSFLINFLDDEFEAIPDTLLLDLEIAPSAGKSKRVEHLVVVNDGISFRIYDLNVSPCDILHQTRGWQLTGLLFLYLGAQSSKV